MDFYLSHPVNINIVIFIIIPEAGEGGGQGRLASDRAQNVKMLAASVPS